MEWSRAYVIARLHPYTEKGGFAAISAAMPHHTFHHCILVRPDLIDESRGFRFPGLYPTAGLGQFSGPDLRNQLDNARNHANVDFTDRQKRILFGVAHVTGGHHIQSAAEAASLDSSRNRCPAGCQDAEGVLQRRGFGEERSSVLGVIFVARPDAFLPQNP